MVAELLTATKDDAVIAEVHNLQDITKGDATVQTRREQRAIFRSVKWDGVTQNTLKIDVNRNIVTTVSTMLRANVGMRGWGKIHVVSGFAMYFS